MNINSSTISDERALLVANSLKKGFDSYFSIPVSFWLSIAYLGEIVIVDKEKTLKENGKTEKYLNFILSGSGGILLWNKNNFLCTDLLMEGEFFCDYYSFITQQPTPYEVITFEKSELFRISYDDLNNFLKNNEYCDKFWRYSTQALYVDKHNQHIQAFTLTAAEIYKIFQEHAPSVLQRIPQKYIASYLGITPQSLSRIRSSV